MRAEATRQLSGRCEGPTRRRARRWSIWLGNTMISLTIGRGLRANGRLRKNRARRAARLLPADTPRAPFAARLYSASMGALMLRQGLVRGRRQDIAIQDGRIHR